MSPTPVRQKMNLATENLFIDTGYSQCCHYDEKACGDAVAFKRIPAEERLLAVLTNSLMPCNGRFPALIALMTMFFAAAGGSSLVSALLLTAALVLSVGLTFGATWLLSAPRYLAAAPAIPAALGLLTDKNESRFLTAALSFAAFLAYFVPFLLRWQVW